MKARDPEEDSFPIIAIHDRRNKVCFAHLVPREGVNEYAVKRVTQDLQKILGYAKFVFRSDQEPVLKQLKEAVTRQCMQGEKTKVTQIIAEESLAGESQSNGEIDDEIKQIQGQFRTIRAHTEANYKAKLPETHNSLPWMIRHCCEQRLRSNVGDDGRTPRQGIKGRKFKRESVYLGNAYGI